MRKCETCGAKILFGPVRQGARQFCSYKCRDQGVEAVANAEFPDAFVYEKARETHDGECPKCRGPGPVETHVSHWVWSLVVISSFKSKPEICCQRCARRSKRRAICFCGLFGWWGFPFGIFGTPFQILKNLRGSNYSNIGEAPSMELLQMVRSELATELMKSNPVDTATGKE